MTRSVAALWCAFVLLWAMPAEAHSRHHHHARHAAYHGLPWCGIWLGQHLGKLDRKLWVARNWAREGVNAGGPDIGVVVVFPHHVGIITGHAPNGQWTVLSGNDGGAVRDRPRSVAGAIAFRRV